MLACRQCRAGEGPIPLGIHKGCPDDHPVLEHRHLGVRRRDSAEGGRGDRVENLTARPGTDDARVRGGDGGPTANLQIVASATEDAPVSVVLFSEIEPFGSRKSPWTAIGGDPGAEPICRTGPLDKLLPPTKLYRTWSGLIPTSTTWLLKFTLDVKFKTTLSPAASPLMVKTLLLLDWKLVTVNTRLPFASRMPSLALIVVVPLMAMDVPVSAPSSVLSELTELRADVTAAPLYFTLPVMTLLMEKWPVFAAEKSILPLMVAGPTS